MRQSTVTALAVATLAVLRPALAADGDGVRLRGTWFEQPVRRAVHAAARRLADPSCASVLDSFRDGSGRTLDERLLELRLEAPDYALMVLFYDGSNDTPCHRPRVFAFTAPGSRVVHACPDLGLLAASQPQRAEAVVIHELLHTLGLRENPPASDEITVAVENHCREP